MITVAIALVIVGSIALVAYPLFRRSEDLDVAFVGVSDPVYENLVTQRDATYSAIKDLENDHAMGKLSDHDYRSLRAKYEMKAVAILQELDAFSGSKSDHTPTANDELIESEVARLRRNSASGAMNCPKCGTAHTADDVFCAKCGTSLRGVRCPSCGKRAALGDKFCSKCGATIEARS
ncbi:MAG: zinc ribbon domain-containing protein [Chloroflexi bacterium]|nr:zinc ribbon domain-containing protein [Chloroflexota bacterium]